MPDTVSAFGVILAVVVCPALIEQLAAKPPLLPSANVIELTVTVLFDPTFLLLNVDVFVDPNVSDPTRPDKVRVTEAEFVALYVLLDAEAVAVNALADISAVVDD